MNLFNPGREIFVSTPGGRGWSLYSSKVLRHKGVIIIGDCYPDKAPIMITTPTPLFFIPFPSPVFSQCFAPSILHLGPLKFFGVSQIDKVPVRMSGQSISHSSSFNTVCFTNLLLTK